MSSSLVLASRRTRASLLALLALAACDSAATANARADANAAANAGGLVADSAAAFGGGAGRTPGSVAAGIPVGEGNPDQGFLRRFVAQQESLAYALDRLSPELTSPVAVAQAQTVRDRLGLEYQVSVGLLRDWFAEWHDADRVPRSDGDLKPPQYRAQLRDASGALARRPVGTDPSSRQAPGGTRDTAGLAPIVPGASGAGGDGLRADAAEAQGWSQDGREPQDGRDTPAGGAVERPPAANADLALRDLIIANHRRTLALTEAYWPHLVQAEVRKLAVDAHRQARLELAALESRENTGAPAPSGQDPRVPTSGVPKAGLDDRNASENRTTVPQQSQRPGAPAPAPPGATPSRTP